MKRLFLLLILAASTACVSDPVPPARGPATAPEQAVEEKEGNFTLYVSNQSFDQKAVDITVTIDGKRVAAQVFDVKNQHNWIDFTMNLPAGAHELRAVSAAGSAHLTTKFTTTARHWAVIDYWCCGEPDDPKFTFNLSDQPIGFA